MFTALSTINLPLTPAASTRLNYRMANSIIDRINIRLKKTGKTARRASLDAGLSDAFIRNILIGKSGTPRADNLQRLADALGTTNLWLLNGTGPEEPSADDAVEALDIPPSAGSNASFPPRYERFPAGTVALMGQSVGGPNGRFVLNGQTIDRLFCPPNLVGVEGAYGVRVYGTSMEPRYFAGETVWINPHEPVRSNDFVVVQLLSPDESGDRESYIKQFVSRSNKTLRLRQLNPDEGEPELLEFPADHVFAVHKIVFQASL